MKISKSSVEGMGLQFQVMEVTSIIKQLETDGKRPALGISMVNLSSVNERVIEQLNLPRDVKNRSLLQKSWRKVVQKAAGLQAYDIIVEMDDKIQRFKTYVKKFFTAIKLAISLK